MAAPNRRRLLIKKKLLLLKLLIIIKAKNKKRYKSKRWWVHPIWRKRKDEGDYETLLKAMRETDHSYFKNYTRMSPEKFDYLLSLTTPFLKSNCFGRSDLISPGEKLALTLRFLATGNSYSSMAYCFRVGKTTVYNIVKQTSQVLWNVLQPIYLPQPTSKTWIAAADEYGSRWNYPNCCGAVDGKHIMITQPPNTGSLYHNYKGFNSIVLMAVVDGSYRFISVDVGAYGSTSDGGVFKASEFGQALESGLLDFPADSFLPGTNKLAPHVLVGDEAFQLLPNFMKPYARDSLTRKTRIFNYRLSRARRCSENAFGILAARWRIFRSCIYMMPENADNVVKATVVLHNFLISEEKNSAKVYCPQEFSDHIDENGQLIEGQWHAELRENPANAFRNITPTSARNYRDIARNNRELFADYFITEEGEVHWQWDITPGVTRPE